MALLAELVWHFDQLDFLILMSLPIMLKCSYYFQAKDLQEGVTRVQTLGGEEVEMIRKGSSVAIRSAAGTAMVVAPDVVASNWVVHLVDSVFLI